MMVVQLESDIFKDTVPSSNYCSFNRHVPDLDMRVISFDMIKPNSHPL